VLDPEKWRTNMPRNTKAGRSAVRTEEVHVELVASVLVGRLFDGTGDVESRAVDNGVDASDSVQNVGHRLADALVLRDIELNAFDTIRAYSGGVAGGSEHTVTLSDETLRRGQADAGGCSDDENHYRSLVEGSARLGADA
jgi:hypothetical protein